MIVEKYDITLVIIIFSLVFGLSYLASPSAATQPTQKSRYEQMVDSLYQINIKIAMEHGRALETNPNAIRPEPAIWFLDFDGNVYDYPPIRENDSILRERESYQRKLDSLRGQQFIELESKRQTQVQQKNK